MADERLKRNKELSLLMDFDEDRLSSHEERPVDEIVNSGDMSFRQICEETGSDHRLYCLGGRGRKY